MEQVDVAVVGGGQAGLAASHELTRAGVEHVVLERGRIGETWRRRWESFCLVTPNWTVQLPGLPYDGNDPHGFMARDDIVAYLQRYAGGFGAPVRENVEVESVRRRASGGFDLTTSSGPWRATTLILATGAYQRPHRIAGADTLPPGPLRMEIGDYRDPGSVPDGDVLVVGSGQTGAQIAEELCVAGRRVYLSCGRAPWLSRRVAGRDMVWWLVESGFLEQPAAGLPSPAARLISNPLASGHEGGHDLHLRTLRAMGVTLTGRFLGADGREALFAPDLGESVAWGDARHRELMELFRRTARERGSEWPEVSEPEPFDQRAPERLDVEGFGAVVFTGGFRPDYRTWLPWPDTFDDLGFPLQLDGESTAVPGLFFVGVHFMRRRKSALLLGVGEDAAAVVRGVVARRRRLAG